MNEAQYGRLSEPFRRKPGALRALRAASKALTAVGYVAYPLLIALLLASGNVALSARCIVVPAVAFIAVSLFRRTFNAPRPYEALDIDPLIAKDTRGKSFPSRHAFSMFMIAASWFAWQPAVGGLLLVAGALMGAIRVVGGVHFPRDVIAGVGVAIAAALVGYVLVPL